MKQFCENKDGSYECVNCDQACLNCSGRGPENCVGGCNKGFRILSETEPNKCVDMNECEMTPHICGNHKQCVNTPGSYECKSKTSFIAYFIATHFFIVFVVVVVVKY